MTNYVDEVPQKKRFVPNVVVKMRDLYFSIHEPDSGLAIPIGQRNIKNLVLNASQVDLKKVTQTIASYSMRLIPTKAFNSLLLNDTTVLLNETVEIWLGRVGVNMDFSDYFKLIDTKVRSMDYRDGTFNLKTREAFDLMTREVFNIETTLTFGIDDTVTSFQGSFIGWPASGKVKVGEELMTYASRDDNNLFGVIRGIDSDAQSHGQGESVFYIWEITGNPVDIMLQVLLSTGDGTNGTYDVLSSGLAIPEMFIDVAKFESIRDEFFPTETYDIDIFNIEDTLKNLLEPEFLQSLNVRFLTTENQKIGITILDQAEFSTATKTITELSISGAPKWRVQQDKVFNVINMSWDFDPATGKYKTVERFVNQESIDKYGETKPLKFKFKGIKSASGGVAIINDRVTRLLERFKTPTPSISLNTHMDKSLYNVGDKVVVTSREMPGATGTLNFADTLEIVSRSISHATGTVQFKLAYTSFTGVGNLAYIAPANSIVTVINQKKVTFGVGLGDHWELGYFVRLYNKNTCAYETFGGVEEIRQIVGIDGDEITFDSNFETTIDPNIHIVRFADYDETVQAQKAFCFIGQGGELPFADGAPPYKITL